MKKQMKKGETLKEYHHRTRLSGYQKTHYKRVGRIASCGSPDGVYNLYAIEVARDETVAIWSVNDGDVKSALIRNDSEGREFFIGLKSKKIYLSSFFGVNVVTKKGRKPTQKKKTPVKVQTIRVIGEFKILKGK